MLVERYRLYTRLFFGTMWVMLCRGFVMTEVFPQLREIDPYIAILADAIFAGLGLLTISSKRDTICFVSFVVISLISKFLNSQGMVEWLNGFRDFTGLLFIIPFIRYMMSREDYGKRFTESMDRQLRIFLYLQAVCVVYQFIIHGAGDYGGGTFGFGGSGMISTLIYGVSFYFMVKGWDYEDGYFNNLYRNRIYVFLLFPTFLNETKISFIYLLAYFVFLMKIDRRFIARLFMSMPVFIALLLLSGYVYMKVTKQESDVIMTADFFNEYLIGEDFEHLMDVAIAVQEEDIETDNIWAMDLPRLGRFFIISDIMKTAKGGMVWGAGIGQFKGNNKMGQTEFGRKNRWFLIGSVTMSFFMIVQLGIVGLLWYVASSVSVIMTHDKYRFANNIRLFMFLIFALLLVYHDSFRYTPFCAIYFFICMVGLQPVMRNKNANEVIENE